MKLARAHPGLAMLLVGALSAAALLIAGCSSSASGIGFNRRGEMVEVDKRKPAGAVRGPLLGGGQYQLASDAGHVVVLNFFASWCAPCQNETPQFDALYRELAPSGVKFVGLDIKDATQSGSQAWLAAKQITFPVVWDQGAKTAIEIGKLPVSGPPDTVVVDKRGRVAAAYAGELSAAELAPVLDRVQAES